MASIRFTMVPIGSGVGLLRIGKQTLTNHLPSGVIIQVRLERGWWVGMEME